MQLNSGIYKITNIVTNDCYMGSALNLRKRKSKHFSDLKLNRHFATYLQNSYNKYGKDNFQFEILAKCPKEYLIKLEQWFLDSLKPAFNTRKLAESSLGVKHSEETKQKMSKIHKGKKVSDDTKVKISEANKGRVFSEEHKLKLSQSASKRKSRILLEETRRLLSKSKLVKPQHKSEETKKRMSKAKKGIVFSEEHKQKLKESALKRSKNLSDRVLGESNPSAKLNWKIVKTIRESKDAVANLSSIYGVAKMTIYKIKNNKIWKEV